jgi:uncharacterized protein YqeY
MQDDMKAAMRGGDTATRDALRYVLAALKNAEIDRRGTLSTDDEVGVLRKMKKQLTDSIDQFRAGGRDDLAEREAAQLAVLERYLPAELSDDELAAIVDAAIGEVGASSMKDMGKVMPVLLARLGSSVDGRRISQAARDRLSVNA